MNRLIYLNISVLLLVLSSCTNSKKAAAASKPNVILIITDDQGFGDISYYGNHNIKTPVLDSLANRSVRFDEFLVSPVCAPTRASIMTGKYAMVTGVHDTYRGGAMMASSEVTIAEVLKKADYKTGMIGKWHLGDNYPMRPQDQGFDYTLNHLSGGIGQYGDWPNTMKKDSSYFNPILWKNGEQYQSKGYCTDVFTESAMDFITENKDDPFFLYLSYNAPHGPLQLPQKYYDMYKDIDPDAGFDKALPFPNVTPHSKENARKVYGMVSNIDDNLRNLFQKLEDLKLDENTLVIFMTDNGPQHPRYVAGMRGRKGSVFQGGVRVPSFWYFPKAFKESRDIKSTANHYDILPTLAEFCGAEIPAELQIEGKSLLPVLTNKQENGSENIINRYWARDAPVKYRNISTRKGNYKFVGVGKDSINQDKFELFDLSNDPYEKNDISNSNEAIVKELRSEMDDWLDKMMTTEHFVNSPRPIVGTEFESPVMLNQNDAMFVKDVQIKKDLIYWDISIDKAKKYNVIVHMDEEVKTDGKLELMFGEESRVVNFKGTNQLSFVIKDVELKKGELTIMPKIFFKENNKMEYKYPFYLEIEG
ncbi:UNVERIFIED_CONTAM: hypothetical protein GTU68_000148 [Idotea baltica]|nr:hypothetical protein [Idotea baltica]